MSDFYLHAINTTGDISCIFESVEYLEKILATGALLTRHALGLLGNGFNGTRYISLSDYGKRHNNVYKDDPQFSDYTAYEMYSTKAVSLAFPKENLKVVHPTLIDPLDISLLSMLKFYGASRDMLSKRISDLPDEVQVKGSITLEKASGVTIPVREINNRFKERKLLEIFKKICLLLEEYEYGFKVYDVESMEELTSSDDVLQVAKRSH